ncbi:MAG: hypothetical protein JO246_00905 [Frankiaceae bacterium]|nr:hypothetical protein [Frankiaceae bacterium]
MKATQAYDQVTGGRPLSPKVHEWISDLVDRFGDDAVSVAIEGEAAAGKFDKLLYRVRDRLAAQQQRVSAPTEITGRQMLAIVRGAEQEPDPPYVWDPRGLTGAEYQEILAWRAGPRSAPWLA